MTTSRTNPLIKVTEGKRQRREPRSERLVRRASGDWNDGYPFTSPVAKFQGGISGVCMT